MPARRKSRSSSPRRSPRRSKGSRSPRRVLKRRSSGKARTSRRAAVRRSPKRRTYKGTRVYGMNAGDGFGKRQSNGDGRGDPSKKLRTDLPETIQKLLKNLEEGEEHQTRKARAQVRALLNFMAQQQVRRAIVETVAIMQAAGTLRDLQYGENDELIRAFVTIPLDLDEDADNDSDGDAGNDSDATQY